MNTFAELRRLAEVKRDEAIQEAKSEYLATLAGIADLENKLASKPVPAPRPKTSRTHPLIDLVFDSLPQDRPFTLVDVVAAMKAADPDRKFSTPSVRTNIHRLIKQRAVKRVRHAVAHGCSIYAVAELDLEESPFGVMTQIQVAEQVLRELGKPVDALTLLFALQERGFQADSDEKTAMNSLSRGMAKKPDVFANIAGNWSAQKR